MLLTLTTSPATGNRDGLLTPTDVNPIAGIVSAPSVTEVKLMVPNEVSAVALLYVVPTPVVFVAEKIPPTSGTEVVPLVGGTEVVPLTGGTEVIPLTGGTEVVPPDKVLTSEAGRIILPISRFATTLKRLGLGLLTEVIVPKRVKGAFVND